MYLIFLFDNQNIKITSDMNKQLFSQDLACFFVFCKFWVRFTLLARGSETPYIEGHY